MPWQRQCTVQQQQQLGFVFPPAGSSLPLRRIGIPTSFKTATAYKEALLAAMTEEVRETFAWSTASCEHCCAPLQASLAAPK